MRFNADRLAALAGLAGGAESNMLTEASNRSMHDDASLKGDAEHRYGKNQLAEDAEIDEEEEEVTEEGLEMDMEEDMEDMSEVQGVFDDDEVIEIDESMLRREILKMRKQKETTVAENKVRQAVRREIQDMFGDKVYSDASWVYGTNKPRRSKQGQVAMGALGIGFKK